MRPTGEPQAGSGGIGEVCMSVSAAASVACGSAPPTHPPFFSHNLRILDLGFEKDLTVILNAVNAEGQKRQNVLLSATLTESE